MAQPEVVKDIEARVKIPGDTMTGNLTAPTFIGSLQGNASSADKLNTSAGSPRQPVYFDNSGQPILAANDYVFYDEVSAGSLPNNTDLFVLKSGDVMTGTLQMAKHYGIFTRHIDGSLDGFSGELYLNYHNNAPIILGHGGGYYISADGSYYTGNCRCISGYGDNTPALRWHALEFVSNSMTIGTGNGQCQPGSGTTSGVWYYPPEGTYQTSTGANVQVIRITWQPNVWVNELFFSPNSNRFYHRSIQNGTALNWRQIWEAGDSVTGAVWNDYAECREADTIEPGYVLIEKGDDTLTKSTERLQPFAGVSSDTWGFSQGETDKAKTPIAVAGRVLVYPWQDRNNYKPGDCVCAAPEGKVDIMTREEIIQYPDRIVGTVSNVPNYETWGGGERADRDPVSVNGRIWIKVK